VLEIQKMLREGWTPEAIAAPLGIKVRYKDHKVLFSYDQIESIPFKAHPIVKECRGLILYEDSWDVASHAFDRFLNYGEDGADELPVDLKDCFVLEKLDGSMISMYWCKVNNRWSCSTRSMLDAEGPVSDLEDMTFADLFWQAMDKTNFKFLYEENKLPSSLTYVFELTSPFNRIVTKYDDIRATLLTVRSNVGGCEFSRKAVEGMASLLGCPVVKAVDARDWQELLKMENADGSKKDCMFEGYVIVKEDTPSHKRNKMKNPAYVALHKVVTSMSERNLMELITAGLQDDFIVQFPEYKEKAEAMIEGIHSVVRDIRNDWDALKHIENRKEFAQLALKTKFSHYLFALMDGRVTPEGMAEYLIAQRTDAILEAIRKVGYK
jgi:hypothetical protein